MVSPDAVLVADRPATLDDRVAGRPLQAPPSVEGCVRVVVEANDVRHVQARAGRVEVRQVAEDVDTFAIGLEAARERPLDTLRETADPRPVRRRFERVDGIAGIPQGVPQVGRAEAGPEPLPSERAADARATVTPNDGSDLANGQLDELLGATGSDEEKRRVGPDAAHPEPGTQRPDTTGSAAQGEQALGLGRAGEARPRDP